MSFIWEWCIQITVLNSSSHSWFSNVNLKMPSCSSKLTAINSVYREISRSVVGILIFTSSLTDTISITEWNKIALRQISYSIIIWKFKAEYWSYCPTGVPAHPLWPHYRSSQSENKKFIIFIWQSKKILPIFLVTNFA